MRPHGTAALALALAATPAAQGVLLPGGTPDPGHAAFHAWFDAADGVNGPGQPADLTPVTRWNDRTGNGHDLVRVDASPVRQPTFWAPTPGGQPVVRFDGDDYIWGGGASEFGALTGAKTVLVVARARKADGGYVFDSSTVQGRNALFTGQLSAPGKWHVYAGTGGATAGPSVDAGRWHVHAVTFEAGQHEHHLDGTSVSIGSAPTAQLIGLILGSRYTVTLGLDGEIAEVLVYDEALSAADRQSLEGYLLARHGLPHDLWGYTDAISVASGGQQALFLDAGVQHAGLSYLLLGTLSGTAPGLVFEGHLLPLNPDIYWMYTLQNPNQAPFDASFGTLDGAGRASVVLTIPTGLGPGWGLGLTMHHAYATFQLVPTFAVHGASVPVALELIP